MILVVGSTGRLGSEITYNLLKRNLPVRMIVRSNSPFQGLVQAGAEAVKGDLKDPESLVKSCSGIDVVIASATAVVRDPPDDLESVDIKGYQNLIKAAKASGVGQFIFVSAALADSYSQIPLFRTKGLTESFLSSSGLQYTVLAPDMFMESWVRYVVMEPASRRKPILLVGNGEIKHSFISRHDVAKFTVSVLGDPNALGRRILLGGPEAMSWMDVVRLYENITGERLKVRHLMPGMQYDSMSEDELEFMASMEAHSTVIDMGSISQHYSISMIKVEDYIRSCLEGGI